MTVSAQTAHANGNGTAVNATKYSKEVNTARDYYNSDDADTVRVSTLFNVCRPATDACLQFYHLCWGDGNGDHIVSSSSF